MLMILVVGFYAKFFEAAITSPDMFKHYTHFGKQTGFVEVGRNTEFDLFIEYVKSIKEKTSEKEEIKMYYPHPKWLEFRNRVDAAELNNDRRWELHEVFKEEAKRNSLMNQYQGIHYKDGLGMKLMMEHNE